MTPISVVVADSKKHRRETCRQLLTATKGVHVIGEARTSREAASVTALTPRLILLDLNLVRGGRAFSLPLIRAQSPRTKVILLVDDASHEEILTAISHGAQGYLGTPSLNRYLVKAVRTVDGGETWIPRKMVGQILDRLAYVKTQHNRL